MLCITVCTVCVLASTGSLQWSADQAQSTVTRWGAGGGGPLQGGYQLGVGEGGGYP